MRRSRRRFVFDTNVIVSALSFPRSTPRRALDAATASGVLLASDDTLAELVGVLHRPKLASYLLPSERERFLERFVAEARFVRITERVAVCRDPRDDKFLELAAAGRADFLITGDSDLLALGAFRGTVITTPVAFR